MDFTNIVHSQKVREARMLTPKAKGDEMSQLKQRANVFFLHLSVLLKPSAEGMVTPTLVKAIFFTQPIDSNASLFLRHPPKHIQK